MSNRKLEKARAAIVRAPAMALADGPARYRVAWAIDVDALDAAEAARLACEAFARRLLGRLGGAVGGGGRPGGGAAVGDRRAPGRISGWSYLRGGRRGLRRASVGIKLTDA